MKCKIFIVLLIFASIFPLMKSYAVETVSKALIFKQTELGVEGEVRANYRNVKKLYPKFKEFSLPKNLLIHKIPDLEFHKNDIVYIKLWNVLEAEELIPQQVRVGIRFTKSAGKRLEKFTDKNLNKLVALELNGKIIQIATVAMVLKKEISIIFVNTSVHDIEIIFQDLSANIIIEDK